MKNWTEISDKYKDTDLMEEFAKYCLGYTEKQDETVLTYFEDSFDDIKDIWGYIICFAETKDFDWDRIEEAKSFTSLDKWMLWCTEKFFEEAK